MDSLETKEVGADEKPQRRSSQASSHESRPGTAASGKGRKRPQSRASTTSAHSATTQPALQPAPDSQFEFQKQQQEAFQMSTEDMLLQSAQQLNEEAQSFPLDPSLAGTANQDISFNGTADYSGFSGADNSHLLDIATNGEGTATPEPGAEAKPTTGKPAKKTSAASAQNDLELKRLFRQNESKSLQDVATQLQGNERGPQSEKTRQIFAMLWLNSACKKSTGSVPRGRVYGHYVSRCGTERVTVLNPASFGKLVRVMFPAIQTRRLGMRGESKYHYCGLSLQEDQPGIPGASKTEGKESQGFPVFSQSFPSQTGPSPSPQLPADTAVFPSPDVAMDSSRRKPKPRHSRASSSLFWDPNSADFDFNNPNYGSGMIERELHFPASPETTFRENEPIDLPDINLYLPAGTDHDTAAALTALYRSNCTSLIDCVRFCREKPFFHFFTSFHGTLTVPVQKLLANPALAPWIKECDWLMYQKMIRVVAPLTLQVVPKQVVDFLKAISKKLGTHIKSSFASHPAHVIEAKLGPATIFANLLDRTLRVNMAAHAAANILCNNANRDQMYEEWIMNVESVKIIQNELPNCGYSEVLHIMTNEIRGLLEPLGISWDGNADHQDDQLANSSTEGVLDRWTNFLTGLPERFPKADARTIITCVNAIATAALRDITMNGGKSFGSWWITKLWLDEMLAWLAEKGGFMDHTAPTNPQDELAANNNNNNNINSFSTSLQDHLEDPFHLSRSLRSAASSRNSSHGSAAMVSTADSPAFPGHPEATETPFDLPLTTNTNHHNANTNGPPTFTHHHTRPSLPPSSTSISSTTNPNNENRPPPTLTVSHATLAAQAAASSSFAKDHSQRYGHSHDDSGVGMGLGDDDDNMIIGKFAGFGSDGDIMTGGMGGTGGAGDGDVVVC